MQREGEGRWKRLRERGIVEGKATAEEGTGPDPRTGSDVRCATGNEWCRRDEADTAAGMDGNATGSEMDGGSEVSGRWSVRSVMVE